MHSSLGLCRDRRATTRAILLRPTCPGEGNAQWRRRSCGTNLSITCSQSCDIPKSAGVRPDLPRWQARAFTFGEGTLVTCWHCVKQPLGPDEFYGIAVRRGSIESPYEFCSIDNLERDHNGADLALGHIDWMPGRGLTLANDPVLWSERVETYGYPFPLAVPDQVYPDYKALHFYSRFLRGYVTRLARDEAERPVIDLDMLCPPGLSGAPVIREDRRDVIGVIFEEQITTMYERTVIFGRAHHVDVLRSACAAVTGGGH
jgi:hypothetical protein